MDGHLLDFPTKWNLKYLSHFIIHPQPLQIEYKENKGKSLIIIADQKIPFIYNYYFEIKIIKINPQNNNDNNNIKLLAKSIECIIKKYIERLLVIAKLNELQESFKELMVQYLSSDLCKITESMDRNDIEYDMYEINELKNIFEHDVQYAYEPEEYYNLALSLRPDRPSIYYNLALNPNNNIYRIDSFSEDEYDGDTITLNSIANDTNDDNNINNTTEYYQLNKILIQLKILSQTNKTFVVGMVAVSILLGCYTINFGIVITLSSILCIITLMNIFYCSLYFSILWTYVCFTNERTKCLLEMKEHCQVLGFCGSYLSELYTLAAVYSHISKTRQISLKFVVNKISNTWIAILVSLKFVTNRISNTWIAILAIVFDAALFSLFSSKWYSVMSIFMEEMATSLLAQFSLVIMGMISGVNNVQL
eukprot:317460_1